jgi:NAD-dependent deacetylase
MRQDDEAPARKEIDRLRSLLDGAARTIAFTGAGISTEAGIPDFRSPGGLWSQMEPITFQEFAGSAEARLEDWRRRFVMNEQFARAQPTIAHRALCKMVDDGRMPAIITQNIDGLHQRSGVDVGRIIELHGNATYGHCIDCRTRMELEEVRRHIDATQSCPTCPACGGLVKAAVVSFGESMPQDLMANAADFCRNADMIIVIGTSLLVQPAASLPRLGAESGARLAIINRQSTPLDGWADLVLNHSSDSVFAALAPR